MFFCLLLLFLIQSLLFSERIFFCCSQVHLTEDQSCLLFFIAIFYYFFLFLTLFLISLSMTWYLFSFVIIYFCHFQVTHLLKNQQGNCSLFILRVYNLGNFRAVEQSRALYFSHRVLKAHALLYFLLFQNDFWENVCWCYQGYFLTFSNEVLTVVKVFFQAHLAMDLIFSYGCLRNSNSSKFIISIVHMQELNQKQWQLATRVNYHQQSLFKLKAINDEQFITHLPTKRIIATFDNNLQDMFKNHTFSQEIQAIEYFTYDGSTYVAAGTKQGLIELKHIEQDKKYQLSSPQAIQTAHKYVNDMLYLGQGRLINCYNNGKIAIWNLNSPLDNNLQPISLKQIHSSFTYKLRRVDPQTLLTCSNDGFAKLIDLQECKILDSFEHEDGVWCAYPLNQNVFCTGGLMNKLLFWDSRQKKIINKCELQNQQVSFITKLDHSQIIFGDRQDICTCDLRKPMKSLFGNAKMRTSVESILVRENSVIITGRGGDLCSFIHSGEPVTLKERSIGEPFIQFGHQLPIHLQNILRNFLNRRNIQDNFYDNFGIDDEDEDPWNDENLEESEDQENHSQQMESEQFDQPRHHQEHSESDQKESSQEEEKE